MIPGIAFRDHVAAWLRERFPDLVVNTAHLPTPSGAATTLSVQLYGDKAGNQDRSKMFARTFRLSFSLTRRLTGANRDALADAGLLAAGVARDALLHSRVDGFFCAEAAFEEPMASEAQYGELNFLLVRFIAEFQGYDDP